MTDRITSAPAGAKAPAAKKLRTYRVCYVATIAEWYEIEAKSRADAEERAYCEGVQVDRLGNDCDRGECSTVVPTGDIILVKKGGAQ